MSHNFGAALIIVDVQYDFLPGGALEVPEGDKIIPVVKDLREKLVWDAVVLTQDWHPSDHKSFAFNNYDADLFSVKEFYYGAQTMWPMHCVQGTHGAEIHPEVLQPGDIIVQKGTNPEVDSYSGFLENDKVKHTGLDAILKAKSIKKVFIAGLATDYCVAATADDAIKLGYETTIIFDACRSISDIRCIAEIEALESKGCKLVSSTSLFSQNQ